MSKYECMNCHSIHNLDEYKDTECDGDVFGKCPTCNKTSVLIEVDEEVLLNLQDTRQYQKDMLYETVCQVKEMLETDRSITDIKQYLKSITGKERYGMSEIYALAYCYDFMESI